MRSTLYGLLIACAAVGGFFILGAAQDLRSAVQEIELEIGVLIVTVALGALYLGTSKPTQQQSGYVPPYPPPPQGQ